MYVTNTFSIYAHNTYLLNIYRNTNTQPYEWPSSTSEVCERYDDQRRVVVIGNFERMIMIRFLAVVPRAKRH